MKRFALVLALLSIALVAAGVYAASGKTAAFFTTGQFPTGGGNIVITVSDPAVCSAPAGHFSHIYVTITDVEAGKEATAEADTSNLVDLTPDLAAQPVQIDLLGQPDTRCTLGLIGQGFAKPGTYKMLRVHLLEPSLAPNGSLFIPPIPGGNHCRSAPSPAANCVVLASGAVLPLGLTPAPYFDIGPDAMPGGKLVVGSTGPTELNIGLDGCASLIPVVSSGEPGRFSFSAEARAYVLERAAAISGRVLDAANGAPISGRAIVAVEQQDSAGIDRIVMETTPDADGRFVLCPLPEGRYDLVAVALNRAQTAYAPVVLLGVPDGSAIGTIALLRAGATTSPEPATVVGQVSLLDGTALGFGHVRLSVLAQAVAQAANVTFTLPLPQSTAGTIAIAGPGAIPYSFRVPAAYPRVTVYSSDPLNFSQQTGSHPSFRIEAQGCGSTATSPTSVTVTAGGTASVPILTITTCNPA